MRVFWSVPFFALLPFPFHDHRRRIGGNSLDLLPAAERAFDEPTPVLLFRLAARARVVQESLEGHTIDRRVIKW